MLSRLLFVVAALALVHTAVIPVAPDALAARSGPPASGSPAGEAGRADPGEIEPGQVVVQFRDGAAPGRAALLEAGPGVARLAEAPALGAALYSVPAGRELEYSRQFAAQPGVVYAGPNHVYRLHDVPPGGTPAAIAAPTPLAPDDGAVLTAFSTRLSWSLPPGAAVFQLQVRPAGDDGPGIDWVGLPAESFTIPSPPQWYGLLPDMTYTWRVRANEVEVRDPAAAGWGPWSEARTFHTPPASSALLQPVSPAQGAGIRTTMPSLQWSDGQPGVFYYEVQISTDPRFDTTTGSSSAAVYWLLVHGGMTSPPNSYAVPPAFALTPGRTYYWRVRPRIQGDGTPAVWSVSWQFTVAADAAAAPELPHLPASPPPTQAPRTPAGPPNDPYFSSQWNLARINATDAWEISQGSSSIGVAVIDSGVDIGHPDLAGRLAQGYNCLHPGTLPEDDNGHGTHVAGIIASATNNKLGIAGLAPLTPVMPIKAVRSDGRADGLCVADSIRFAVDAGVRIINLSLGGAPDYLVESALRYAYDHNVLLVASAGNCGSNDAFFDPGCEYEQNPSLYPAASPYVLSVGATGPDDGRAPYSSVVPYVRIAAPGGYLKPGQSPAEAEILSTCWRAGGGCTLKDGYTSQEGTSMAAPHVAAIAALVWAANPSLTALQVARIMELTAQDKGAPGRDNEFGYGRVEALQAVQAARGPAPAVTPLPFPPQPTATPTLPPDRPAPATPTPTPTPFRLSPLVFGTIGFDTARPDVDTCLLPDASASFPAGPVLIYYTAAYEGSGEYNRRVYLDGDLISSTRLTAPGGERCLRSAVQGPQGFPLAPGTYTVELRVTNRQPVRGFFRIEGRRSEPTPTATRTSTPPATRTPTPTPESSSATPTPAALSPTPTPTPPSAEPSTVTPTPARTLTATPPPTTTTPAPTATNMPSPTQTGTGTP